MIDTIKVTFAQKLDEMGIEIENTKTKKVFKSLVSSGDFSATFLLTDQENEEQLQGVTWLEDLPKTGEILKIENNFYRVANTQKRIGSPIARFTANLTQRKIKRNG